ncbi:glucose-6-phosphate isomerase [Buchnera aphidicola (Ceratoglyphina bambusae)]
MIYKNYKYYKKLLNNFKYMKNVHMKDLFLNSKNRFKKFSINFKDYLLLDYSKNIVDNNTMYNLFKFAEEINIYDEILKMFSGEKINETENNSVLHIALRNLRNIPIFVDKKNVMHEINLCLKKMKKFSNNVINGAWRGCTNKKIKNIINIGIGGSELGPKMVNYALKDYKNHLNIYYLSNVDNNNLIDILNNIDIESSLFLIVSKTFSTSETIVNSNSIKKYFLKKFNNKDFIANHFCAISNNTNASIKFGIRKENIFKIFDWIGGRYSVWSSVGLSVMLSIGYKNFKKFLAGANKMDVHFCNKSYNKNIPIILALLSFWYIFFFNTSTEAVLTYNNRLSKFYNYLQQLNMESNGKNIDKNGKRVSYNTCPIIWGGTGTNCQHSFFQLLHQGTRLIPCDFIAFVNNFSNLFYNHNLHLLSNFFAQTQALSFGDSVLSKNLKNDFFNIRKKDNYLFHKKFFGNIPSNSILFKKLDPYSLGLLLSLYEHKTFVQGVIFNIFSFDQWGVELGKTLSNNIYNMLKKNNDINYKYDSSTNGLINFYKKWKYK